MKTSNNSQLPSVIVESRFAQNSDIPSQSALRRVARAYNHVSINQRRQIISMFSSSGSNAGAYQPATASERNIFFCFRTGENVSSIAMYVGIAPVSGGAITSSPPKISMRLDNGISTIDSGDIHHPLQGFLLGSWSPSEIKWGWAEIKNIASNTLLLGSILQSNFSRITSLLIYEKASQIADSSEDGVSDESAWETGKPIYDADVQDLAETGTLLWRHNAAMLVAWSRTDNVGIIVTSTSYVNLHDSTISIWGATELGYIINTLYHDSHSGDIPLEFGIYATRTAGAGTLSVKFLDSGGTWVEFTGISTTGSMYTAIATAIAQSSTKTDIHVKVSSGTWRIDAMSLWEYEA